MDSGAESKFNEGIAKLNRIGMQRTLIMQYRPKRKWYKIFDCLVNIRTEIWERMNIDERKEVKDFESKIRNDFYVKQDKRGLDITMLENYEDRLQELCYKYGLSMPDKDDFLEPENF